MNPKEEKREKVEVESVPTSTAVNSSQPQSNFPLCGTKPNITMNRLPIANKIDSNSGEMECDSSSLRGQFGWEKIGNEYLPYVLRDAEKFCAVRMAEMTALKKYLKLFHQDICNCISIKSYTVTVREGFLLTEINIKHSDFRFGKECFTRRDQLVRLSDVMQFYNFLHYCHTKLNNGDVTPDSKRNGFVRLDKESVIPYVISNGEKFAPLFCFEGETEVLQTSVKTLSGWDLTYLKFCCLVQGIRLKLFQEDSCAVVNLEVVKRYFPPNTLFEDFWPKSVVNSHLLKCEKATSIKLWTTLQTPVESVTAIPPDTVYERKKLLGVKRQYPFARNVATPQDSDSGSQSVHQPNCLPTLLTKQPERPQQNPQICQNTVQLQQADAYRERSVYDCVQIPEELHYSDSINFPYRIQQVIIEDKLLFCINFKPYQQNELLVTVRDVNILFFHNVNLTACHNVLKVLHVCIYKPNSLQLRVLMRGGKCFSLTEHIFLIKLNDLVDYMPQLKYMLGAHIQARLNK